MWALLNRRHLPRRMVQTITRGLVLSGALIVAISLAPGVSGMGHLGGAVVGLVVALLFHLQQFGSPAVSKLAVLGLLAVPVACVLGLRQVSVRDPAWHELLVHVEAERLAHLQKGTAALYEAGLNLRKQLRPLLEDTHPKRRDADEVSAAVDRLSELARGYQETSEEMAREKPFQTPAFEEFRQAGREYFRLRAAYLARVQTTLEKKAPWEEGDNTELIDAQQRWVKAYRAVTPHLP
jgi:hypothetical protein